jgi:glucan phosphoethanolaminetransferase (alkaline phosphatase superfamily)
MLKIPSRRNNLIKHYGSIENANKAMRKISEPNPDNITSYFMDRFYMLIVLTYVAGLCLIALHYIKRIIALPKELWFILLLIILVLGLTYILIHFTSDRKDIYKNYFKKFDTIKGGKRFACKIMTLIFVLSGFPFLLWAMDFANR